MSFAQLNKSKPTFLYYLILSQQSVTMENIDSLAGAGNPLAGKKFQVEAVGAASQGEFRFPVSFRSLKRPHLEAQIVPTAVER